MRQVVQEYIENPSPSLLLQLTTEEQNFVERSKPKKKEVKKKVSGKEKAKEEEEA